MGTVTNGTAFKQMTKDELKASADPTAGKFAVISNGKPYAKDITDPTKDYKNYQGAIKKGWEIKFFGGTTLKINAIPKFAGKPAIGYSDKLNFYGENKATDVTGSAYLLAAKPTTAVDKSTVTAATGWEIGVACSKTDSTKASTDGKFGKVALAWTEANEDIRICVPVSGTKAVKTVFFVRTAASYVSGKTNEANAPSKAKKVTVTSLNKPAKADTKGKAYKTKDMVISGTLKTEKVPKSTVLDTAQFALFGDKTKIFVATVDPKGKKAPAENPRCG